MPRSRIRALRRSSVARFLRERMSPMTALRFALVKMSGANRVLYAASGSRYHPVHDRSHFEGQSPAR